MRDNEMFDIIAQEEQRQLDNVELIASENFVSREVREAQGSVLTNKYAEGLPGHRYYGGCVNVDKAEQLTKDRAMKLFGAEFVNVQPHSGAQANMAVYNAILQPGDVVMGMNLTSGGHLTHGSGVNFSGKLYHFIEYNVNKETELIDYDELEHMAMIIKPKLIVAGASAYPRIIDFKRNKDGIPAKVATIEYDPNRNARIALLNYVDGEKRYILAPLDLKVGDKVVSGPDADIKTGNCLPLKNIPVGTLVHNVELKIGKGGQMARSAGAVVQLMAKEGDYALLRLPSGEVRKVHINCRATIGQVGNLEFENITIGKAGRSRWLGIRPANRGVVMNPNDHPHGGGEGHSPVGRKRPVTPWGKAAFGVRTRKSKKSSTKLIVSRRTK